MAIIKTSARSSTAVPKAPKRGGLTTKTTRERSAAVAAAFQKKYAEVRATRPKLGKGITVDDLMKFYFLPELKQELRNVGIPYTDVPKRFLCHRVAAFVNEGRRLSKKRRYVPSGHIPKPRPKKGQAKPKAPKTTQTVDASSSLPTTLHFVSAPLPTRRRSSIAASSQAQQTTQTTTHRHEHKWQYEDKAKANGPWHNYDIPASDLVEDAYVDWKKDPHVDVRAVKSGEWEYMVDFNSMEQQNVKHTAHTRRKIRRVTVSGNQLAESEGNEIRKRVQAQRAAAKK